jgi:hypothetical protein
MNLRLVVAILVIAALPGWARAQSAVTNEDAQQVVGMISSDKDKTQAYCDILKLSDQIEHADQADADTDQLKRQMDELTQKLGPEYANLIAAYKDMDLTTRTGLETGATVQAVIVALGKLCGPEVRRSGRE